MLITALHHAGLATLTPFLLLVAGYPAADAQVPVIERQPLDRIATFVG